MHLAVNASGGYKIDGGDGLDDSIASDVNDDGRPDSLAFSASEEPLPPGKRGSGEFDVQYTTCPQPFVGSGEDTTPIDYEVSVDACHRGDPAPLGFGGGSCPGLGRALYPLFSTSARIRAISSSSFIAPRSSPLRRRTAAEPASASRSPTTSM